MNTTIQIDQASAKRLIHNLSQLPKGVARLQLIKALNAAGAPAKLTAKALAARETGLLSKSMIVVVPRDKNTKIPTGVQIGPSRTVKKFVRSGKTLGPKKASKLQAKGIKLKLRRPTRYAHLAEKKSPAIHAAARTLETVGMARLESKIAEGIATEAAKLRK